MQNHRSELTRRRLLTGAGAAGAAILAGCTSANEEENGGGLSGDISMAGSSTVFPLAEAVAEQFMKDHPEVNISVSPTGTGGGFNNNFCTGSAAFNNASRKITEGEKESCAENDIVPIELRVATDALTVVVNNEADWIECMTVDENDRRVGITFRVDLATGRTIPLNATPRFIFRKCAR